MILKLFTITIDSNRSRLETVDQLRPFLAGKFSLYTDLHKEESARFIHRYPVLQCKIVENRILVLGINEGAEFLREFSGETTGFSANGIACTITEREPLVRDEEFALRAEATSYEFLTQWLALNQQNAKKFYTLQGKPARDTFMKMILADNLATLAKSLGYDLPSPITCEGTIRFKKDRIDNTNVMVFSGKFRTNLRIPDYLGIGQSVSAGFGTLRKV